MTIRDGKKLKIWGFSQLSLFTAGTLTGFDASGHVAEETKHAK
jgi:translation initiation factor 5B